MIHHVLLHHTRGTKTNLTLFFFSVLLYPIPSPPPREGMRPCPPDAKPYMGKVPGWSGAYINAGHNCWGIAWAPACGKAMSELILEGASRSVDLRPFDPARFAPPGGGRGGRGRKKGTVNIGEQW